MQNVGMWECRKVFFGPPPQFLFREGTPPKKKKIWGPPNKVSLATRPKKFFQDPPQKVFKDKPPPIFWGGPPPNFF